MMSTSSSPQIDGLGVLLFAFNNEEVDYLGLAVQAAERIKRLWHCPVSIVTNAQTHHPVWDQVIGVPNQMKANPKLYIDYKRNLSFWNGNRCQALDLTPYDRTIVLDVDLLVQTDEIVRAWNGEHIALSRTAHSVYNNQPLSKDMLKLGAKTPMYWATVLCFDRHSAVAQTFFQEWKRALQNYQAYSAIYGFASVPVRNDFAVTIAMLKVLDHMYQSNLYDLPYSIPTLMPLSWLKQIEESAVLVNNGEEEALLWSDVHIMNKKSILKCLNSSTPTSIPTTSANLAAS